MRADASNLDLNKYTPVTPQAPIKKPESKTETGTAAIEQSPPAAAQPAPPQNTVNIGDNKSYDFAQEVTFGQSSISSSSVESVQRVGSLSETPDLPSLDDLATAVDFWKASAQAFEEGAIEIGTSLWEVAKEFDPGVPDPRLP